MVTRQRARCSYATSPLSLYHLQLLPHNFFLLGHKYNGYFSREVCLDKGRRKSFDSHTKQRKGKRGSDYLLQDFVFICTVGEREKDLKREKERKRTKRPLRPKVESGESEEDGKEKRRELRGRLVVKMKAPPLVAAPFVRGRRNRPIDSCIYPWRRHDSAWPTTTLATADDSWCSWPESLLRIRRSSFRRSIVSCYRSTPLRSALNRA